MISASFRVASLGRFCCGFHFLLGQTKVLLDACRILSGENIAGCQSQQSAAQHGGNLAHFHVLYISSGSHCRQPNQLSNNPVDEWARAFNNRVE
jgi:hypothetical protein